MASFETLRPLLENRSHSPLNIGEVLLDLGIQEVPSLSSATPQRPKLDSCPE